MRGLPTGSKRVLFDAAGAVNLTVVFFLRFFIAPIPLVVTAMFFLMTGVYVGYLISHYSTKYLKNVRDQEL
jgi:hypothetical protein